MENGEQGSGEWSVIMTGWHGDPAMGVTFESFAETVRRAVGREGLDSVSLSLFAKDYLPAELVGGLSRADADRIAGQLCRAGAEVSVVASEELPPLRYRSDGVWAETCGEHYCFSKVDGLITALGAANARGNVQHLGEATQPWRAEQALNHMHPLFSKSIDEMIDSQREQVDALVQDLADEYPGKPFTISLSLLDVVSFWQTTDDSPREELVLTDERNSEGRVFCWACGHYRDFDPDTYVHERFPAAGWGKCGECGARVLVHGCEKRIFIGAGSDGLTAER